jgi:mono/diheme cytochrome c family protein
MRFMGGASVFIPASDIKSGNFVGMRSVMPKGLIDNFSEEQIADILAYIRSLK